jgi:hypothetical protein
MQRSGRKVIVEYLDGDGEEVVIRSVLADVPRRGDRVLLRRPGVLLRVESVEWRTPLGTGDPEVVIFGRLGDG